VSNKGDIIVLVPGASGWEVWEGPPPQGFIRKEVLDVSRPGQILGLSPLPVVLCFPVKSATVMPFKASSADDSLFEELAQMHSERMGVRSDPGAGRLQDYFVIEKGEDSAVLSTVVLRAPVDGDLPPRSPKEFDYTPRVYHFSGDGIATWKELGHWVFAFYQNGKMLYAQATSGDSEHPDESLLRDVKLAMAQLSLQGLSFQPQDIRVWHPDGELGEAGSLNQVFGITASVGRRPDPRMSEVASRLLPADVHAERRALAKRRQIIGAISAAAALLIGAVGWAVWTLWQDIDATKKLTAEAEAKKPSALAFAEHKARWAEIGPLVDEEQWPVETLFRITKCMPAGGGIRLRLAEISNDEVRLTGEAQSSPPIGQLSAGIKKSSELTRFNFSPANQTNTSKGWEFTITGAVPQANE
jgi:hypothetical protein